MRKQALGEDYYKRRQTQADARAARVVDARACVIINYSVRPLMDMAS